MNKKLLQKEFDAIKTARIVSIFWITSTNARAVRIEHLERIGAIVRQREVREDAYPNCVFDVDEAKLHEQTS